MIPYLDVQASYAELREELDASYRRVMEAGQYVLGDELEAFEEAFAAAMGTAHAVGVASGLDAIEIALRAHGIGPGDEVIVPAHTFVATWLAVARTGATIVPVDVAEDTLLIEDAAAIEAAVSERSAAIIPVHLYGRPVDMSVIHGITESRGLAVIEDAAQAHGAIWDRRPVGSLGSAAAFSFYPGKNLGAFGDGGAVTTSDEQIARKARSLRNYGSSEPYVHDELAGNSRLDALQAAFLNVKLTALDRWNARRADIARAYRTGLADVEGLALPPAPGPGTRHAWHVFCVRHEQRDELQRRLGAAGIATRIHYPVPPHRSGAFSELGFPVGAFPVAERAAETLLSLPIGPHMSDEQVRDVIAAVRQSAHSVSA